MLSPFDMCFTWAGIHARTRSMLNRLSALTVQMELLEEAAPPSGEVSFGQTLKASRAELAEASREARALVEAVGAQLPGAKVADLNAAIKDTLAPLHRFLQRRETQLVGPTGEGDLEVAVEPELLRFAIAAVIDALLAPAVAGEELHVQTEQRLGKVLLSFRLQTRRAPPERAAVEGQLTSVRSWLEMRGGGIDVSTAADRVSVLLTMCPTTDDERC
jgi:hypothetical protein